MHMMELAGEIADGFRAQNSPSSSRRSYNRSAVDCTLGLARGKAGRSIERPSTAPAARRLLGRPRTGSVFGRSGSGFS